MMQSTTMTTRLLAIAKAGERAFLARVAEQTDAAIVDFYEVGERSPRITVVKGRAPLSEARKVADKLEPQARKAVADSLKAMRRLFDPKWFARAYGKRDTQGMLDAFAVAQLGDTLKPTIETVVDAYRRCATAEASVLQHAVAKDRGTATIAWGFDLTNPKAAAWGYQWSAELIQGLGDAGKLAIKDAIGRVMSADLSKHDATLLIQSIIGLNDRQAQAVENWRSELLASGKTSDSIEAALDDYADALLVERATMIARTEIMTAASAGQREAWDQAADKGLLDPTATSRMWIVTDDDRLCDDCEPLDGEAVGLNDEFEDGDPPLHPGCRCTMGLTFD